jgi:hypothetical protein
MYKQSVVGNFRTSYPVFTCFWTQPLGKIICRFNQQKLSIVVLNPAHRNMISASQVKRPYKTVPHPKGPFKTVLHQNQKVPKSIHELR